MADTVPGGLHEPTGRHTLHRGIGVLPRRGRPVRAAGSRSPAAGSPPSGPMTSSPSWPGPRHRGRRPRRRALAPGLPGRARAPGDGRPRDAAVRAARHDVGQECLDIVAEYAAGNPDLEWIVGGGWSMEFFPGGTPTRQTLDAIVPDRPVFLTNRDGHGNWVNTQGARARRHRRRHARPCGRADRARRRRQPDRRPARRRRCRSSAGCCPTTATRTCTPGLLAAQELLFSLGITAWQDAAVGELFGLDDISQST